ncbi:MAG TPA: hypothetical protein VGB08_05685 [Allosphingosinicella sp.]|jgi:Na+/H+ antiporter NhaC
MIALKVARYALLISLLVYFAVFPLALAGAPDVEALFLIGIVATGWMFLSSIACVVLQLFLVLRRRRR